MSTSENTTIGTLRIIGAVEDSPSLRLSFSNMLSSADLRPKGVSPSSILIVLSMEDPLPGRLIPVAMRVNPDWELAAKNYLTRIYYQATRPIQGVIPSDAVAVLFLDEGEMLACLVLDISRGEAGNHWWWKLVLRRINYQTGLKDILCSRATYLPAALYYLVEWGQTGSVANSLSPEEIMTVVSSMGREYGITNLGADVLRALSLNLEQKKFESRRNSAICAKDEKAFWEEQLPIELKSLEKEKRYLIEVGLALYYTPAMVRANLRRLLVRQDDELFDGKYAPEVTKYQQSELESTGEKLIAASSEVVEIIAFKKEALSNDVISDLKFLIPEGSTTIEGVLQNETSYIDIESTPSFTVPLDAAEETTTGTDKNELDASVTRETTLQDSRKGPVEFEGSIDDIKSLGKSFLKGNKEFQQDNNSLSLSLTPKNTNGAEIDEKHSLASPEPANTFQETAPVLELEERTREELKGLKLEDGVDTQIGGVLYLINLMKRLDIPECFEEEFGLASSLSAWEILEVLARALMGDKYEYFAFDPLWRALAELSGREAEKPPGENFYGSDTFHLPPAWLKFISKDVEYYWGSAHNRVRLWSTEYLLIDCPKNESEPETQAKEEFREYGDPLKLIPWSFDNAPSGDISGTFLKGFNKALISWLSMVVPFIHFYLKQVLSDENESLFLFSPGKLFITSTHVDLVMSIENILMPVRLAGLDQDPGWVADFGRVVLFHFE